MSLQTALIDFSLPDTKELGQCEEKVISLLNRQMEAANLERLTEESRHKGIGSVIKLSKYNLSFVTGENVATVSLCGPGDLFILLRLRSPGQLITLSIEGSFLCPSGSCFKDASLPSSSSRSLWASQTELGQWVASVAKELGTEKFNFLPAISRGLELSPYWTTTDDRIIECGITELVHEEESDYQNIQILDTIDFGRVLMLDGQTQLAESDLVYTRSLMAGEIFTDKEVLILGGGDGALLAELMTQDPAMVTMVELDGAVMTAVRDHMASVTRGVLKNNKGERHEIITGDAIKYLEQCGENQKKFDFIFGDLTDVPIDTDAEGC